jgi:hypothetical protein
MIAENYDGKLPLYEHYWCIKVPHHGTQGHYFDFSQYEPENMLISNGIHFANSKKESKELRTSPLFHKQCAIVFARMRRNFSGPWSGENG